MTALTVGSLFSGIGGLDLGLERAGMRVIWQSEIDDYASRVLKKHWPEVPNYGDIKTIDWGTVTPPDVICGGYPCQPFSTAGKRNGKDDPRHLWPWVLDAISELRPRYAILENVRGHLSLGGLSVIGELAAIGYDAEWRIISAASVGANHRRDRVFIVAYPTCFVCHGRGHRGNFSTHEKRRGIQTQTRTGCSHEENVADSTCGDGRGAEPYGLRQVFRQASELRELSSNLGTLGHWWETEPELGRVANGIPDRVDRLKGLGNAVVPQVAEIVGRLVVEHSTH